MANLRAVGPWLVVTWALGLTLGARASSNGAVTVLGCLTDREDGWLGGVVGNGALLGAVLDSNPLLLGGSVGLGALSEGGRLRALHHTSVSGFPKSRYDLLIYLLERNLKDKIGRTYVGLVGSNCTSNNGCGAVRIASASLSEDWGNRSSGDDESGGELHFERFR